MKQINTQAIILNRIDYGEADRILTLLTPDQGKLSLIAKGVRRIKSKLAGGIELFSVSEISFIKGRTDLGTLISTRLITHYDFIVRDITRTMLGYDLIKLLNKATEDELDPSYFELLGQAFAALNDADIDIDLIRIWFVMQMLLISGHSPNLHTLTDGTKLQANLNYEFNYEDVAFAVKPAGKFTADHIKYLRLGFSGNRPDVMQKITGGNHLLEDVTPLVQTMAQSYLRI